MPEAITFEHYEVQTRDDGSLHELGRGAMGITYKAFDTNLRVPVALKVINAAYLDSDVARQRFVREARSAATLRHRNVATVYHLGTEADTWFYAMEYIEGETLEALIKRQGSLRPVHALQIADQVARALNAAQRHGLVHRDIKPANLMLVQEDDELVVKVIDFGLAKNNAAGPEDVAATSMGGFVGTPHFASPEQLEEKEIDVRSDLYSLGVTLWFMLAGQTPFAGSMAQVMDAHLSATPPFEQLAHLPPQLTALLQRLLAKDPAARPQTPAELRDEIEECLGHISGDATAAETVVVQEENFATLLDEAARRPGESAWETGATIAARYRITESRGETNAGKIFRAHDAQLGRDVRLLRLKAELLQSANAVAQIGREIQRIRAVRHQNLLGIHGFESIEGTSYLAMEWTEGFTLLEVLRARQELEAREVLPILAQAAAGADAALAGGLRRVDFALHQIRFHLAPPFDKEALLHTPVGDWPAFTVKLNPLGIAQELSESKTWAGGETMVAPAARQAAPPDPRAASVQALGAVVYEMLGGAVPPGGVLTLKTYTPLATLSEAGNAALKRALDPAASYPSAREFHRALASLESLEIKHHDSRAGSTAHRRAPAVPPPVAPSTAPLPPPRKKIPVAFAGGVATVVAIGAAVWFLARPEDDGKPATPRPIVSITPAPATPPAKVETDPTMAAKRQRSEQLLAALREADAVEKKENAVEALSALVQIARDFPESGDATRSRLQSVITTLRDQPAVLEPETFDQLHPLLEEAARLDVTSAVLLLAKGLRDRDAEKSLAWYCTAANRGDADSMREAGLLLSNLPDKEANFPKAFEYFKWAAAAGDPWVAPMLAECYLSAKGTDKNLKLGRKMLTEAAESRNLRAMNMLADACRKGRFDFPVDHDRAFRLLTSVVETKDPTGDLQRPVGEAFGNLGVLYVLGKGAPKDEKLAAQCFQQGAALRDPNSTFYLGGFICDGTGGLEKDPVKGRALIEQAAAAGSVPAREFLNEEARKPLVK